MRTAAASVDSVTCSDSVPAASGPLRAALHPSWAGGAPGDGASLLPRRLLAVTHDRELALTIVRALAAEGLRIDLASTLAQARTRLRTCGYHVAIIDMQLPAREGLRLLELLRAASPACACLVLTGPRKVAAGVEALREGAADFLLKPVQPAALRQKTWGLLAASPPVVASSLLHAARAERSFAGIVGGTPIMQQLFAQLAALAGQTAPVLITGEPGTGKDLLAHAVHALSRRRGPLLTVHTAALPTAELMLALLGQERIGSEDLRVSVPGLLERAQGGTLLIDEIAELDAGGQRCLRQLLAGGTYAPRGAAQLRRVDVRLIMMSSQPLLERVRRGQFCAELFQRLSTSWLDIPPLRQRREDIPLLAATFLSYAERHHTHGPIDLPAATLLRLKGHSWPGNVSELQAVLRQAAPAPAHDRDQRIRSIEPAIIDQLLLRKSPPAEARFQLGMPMAMVEREVILMTLTAVGGNKQRAAALLGLSRGALYSRLRTYGAQARAQWQAAQQRPR